MTKQRQFPVVLPSSITTTNPLFAALTVLVAGGLGYFVHAGWIDQKEVPAVAGAVVVVGLALWRWCVSRYRTDQALRIADAAPNSVAVVTGKRPE